MNEQDDDGWNSLREQLLALRSRRGPMAELVRLSGVDRGTINAFAAGARDTQVEKIRAIRRGLQLYVRDQQADAIDEMDLGDFLATLSPDEERLMREAAAEIIRRREPRES